MKHRDHNYLSRILLIEYDIRETFYNSLPYAVVHGGMNSGTGGDAMEYVLDPGEEIPSQSGPLLILPIDGGVELGPGMGEKANG